MARPDHPGEGLSSLAHPRPSLILKFAKSSDDCSQQRLAFLRCCGETDSTSIRIVLTTRPSSDERNRIVMTFVSVGGEVLASSRFPFRILD